MIVPTGQLVAQCQTNPEDRILEAAERRQAAEAARDARLESQRALPFDQHGGYSAYMTKRTSDAFQALLDLRRNQLKKGKGLVESMVPSGMAFGGAAAAVAAVNGFERAFQLDGQGSSVHRKEQSKAPKQTVVHQPTQGVGLDGPRGEPVQNPEVAPSQNSPVSERESGWVHEKFLQNVNGSATSLHQREKCVMELSAKHGKSSPVALAISRAAIAKGHSRGSGSLHITESHRLALKGWLRKQWGPISSTKLQLELDNLMNGLKTTHLDHSRLNGAV
mmetsp:Transcript_11866/g.24183  ORF Transcript_11866/g.24183 Transcript_11866/m.24183 type:complete len:277 (-) Transcript_11866:263-1093(-)|eukprot:CAMPEP_0184682056 /NCGR_PEP_ID=MMETSP0312-20130426/5585_1 /TAXON_ID=31354 /ORGANISM="Compsopogon coeruleus, Strain SAG 36.94" /LENGTH=276 /DNA_ID=CAMNT_0027133361 /DNA_START=315 /DNA_END=1145 /DNA_ORIENTATION=-